MDIFTSKGARGRVTVFIPGKGAVAGDEENVFQAEVGLNGDKKLRVALSLRSQPGKPNRFYILDGSYVIRILDMDLDPKAK
jgi:hypothetical protein